jgi:arabinose-5-phosphate isomerase
MGMETTRAATAKAQTDSDLAVARQVLRTEASALEALARALSDTLPRALDLLTRDGGGRVIVTGMGKSGHIGRKIAATLASTGTPAQYVHPGEASHGDLGMITGHDAVLALSNSGETAELSDVLDHSRRFAIPLVAITARAESALAQASDLAIILPDAAEACPHGLTPTTSTTMMLALGDALAVALLERKGFSADDFKVFHPGGKLGRKLLRVADLMHDGDELPLIALDRAMSEALIVMTTKRFGCVGVIDEAGRLAGMVTDGDLRRHMEPGLTERAVREVMTVNPRTVRAGMLAGEALRIMNERRITTFFVVDEDRRPAGILHVHDLLRAGVV